MLSRNARLTKKDNIPSILNRGNLAHSKFLVGRFRPNHLSHDRFSVVVSNKIHKKAVKRNRIKRQLYEIIRRHERSSHRHFDMVILPKKSIIDKTYQDMQDSFNHLMQQLQ